MDGKGITLIGLTRKSRGEDESTHARQAANIERRVAAEDGLTLLRVEKEHKVSGGKSWRKRELGQALEAIKRGEAQGVIVDETDRLTRERLSAAAEIWDSFEAAGAILLDCKGTDSRSEDGEFSFSLNAALARKQYVQYVRRSNAGRARSVIEDGVTGGGEGLHYPGYVFTSQKTLNVNGVAKRGPAKFGPDADSTRETLEAFAARSIDASEMARRLGVGRNRVQGLACSRFYIGEAASGEFVNRNPDGRLDGTRDPVYGMQYGRTQPALISDATHEAICNRFEVQRAEFAGVVSRREMNVTRALSKILRCAISGSGMTWDGDSVSWKCIAGKVGKCPCGAQSIRDDAALAGVVEAAVEAHGFAHPLWSLGRSVDVATKPEAERRYMAAQADVLAEESRLGCTLPPDSNPRKALASALEALRSYQAAQGWVARTPEEVAEMVASGDDAALNSFLRETITVAVAPSQPLPAVEGAKCPKCRAGECTRHAPKSHRTFEARCSTVSLLAGRTAEGAPVESFEGAPVALAAAVEDSAHDGENWLASKFEARLLDDAAARQAEQRS